MIYHVFKLHDEQLVEIRLNTENNHQVGYEIPLRLFPPQADTIPYQLVVRYPWKK